MKSKRRKKDNNLKTQNSITSIKSSVPNNKKIHQQIRDCKKNKSSTKEWKKKKMRERNLEK